MFPASYLQEVVLLLCNTPTTPEDVYTVLTTGDSLLTSGHLSHVLSCPQKSATLEESLALGIRIKTGVVIHYYINPPGHNKTIEEVMFHGFLQWLHVYYKHQLSVSKDTVEVPLK